MHLNHLLMAVMMLILLLVINQYVPLPGLINLIFNCLMIVLIIVYFMQSLNLIEEIVPAPKIFK